MLSDLRKAYDSVDKIKALKLILDRCSTRLEKDLISKIAELHF
jgi:hypothetical protein